MELGGQGRENWIDRRKDGAAIATAEKELGDGSQDQDGALGSDGIQRGIEGGHHGAVDDLRGLHGLSRGHVESSHITANISITNDGVHS